MERTPVGIPASSSHSSRQSTGLSQTPNARPAELFGQRAAHYRCSRFGCQNGLPAAPGKQLLWNSTTERFARDGALMGTAFATEPCIPRGHPSTCGDRSQSHELGISSTCPTWMAPPAWILLEFTERKAFMLTPYWRAMPDSVSPRATLCMSWNGSLESGALSADANRCGASALTALSPLAVSAFVASSGAASAVRCRRLLRSIANQV